MSPTQLIAIREEFYSTTLTIEELCLKYGVEELPGSQRWSKPTELVFSPPPVVDDSGEEDEPSEDLSPEERNLKNSLYTQAENIMKKCNKMLMKVDNPRDLKDIAGIHKDIYQAHFGKVVAPKTDNGEDFTSTLRDLMEKYSD